MKFGTDGWRAIIGDEFTFENVRITSSAIGKLILEETKDKHYPIYIGYDTRFLAKDFAIACANELNNLGLNTRVSTCHLPTPVVAFWAAKEKTNGAIQFTASHNPPKYCGLKYITNYGGPAPVETTDKITKLISSGVRIQDSGSRIQPPVTFEPFDDYLSHLKELISFETIKKSNLKVVYDPLYGAGNGFLDAVLKKANCNVTVIHNKKDPLFGGLLPEPREENLNDLKASVKSASASIGLATDGDADRISAIDQTGSFYSPNKIVSMLLRHLYKNKGLKGNVVRTISTTHLLDHLAKKYGLKSIETKVGFKWICEEMRKDSVLIGAEESGGVSILNHIPDKDAVLAGCLLVEMLAYENKSLDQIYKDTLQDANWHCINDRFDLHINDKEKSKFISRLQKGEIKKFGTVKVKSINTIEGAKYLLEDGSWFLARASGTEPMARVYFEATSQETLDSMKSEVSKLINA